MPVRTSEETLTATECAILGLLTHGPKSGYDLKKAIEGSVGYFWAPAQSQIYAVLPRLVDSGYATSRRVAQSQRPDKQLYRITDAGREALAAWQETVEPGSVEAFFLKLFVGGLSSHENLIAQVEQFRADTEERLAELRAIEPVNTRRGHDYYHYFLLRMGIERREHLLRWADWVLDELRKPRP
jgi:PadR family transcriptional regulator, regulatory protein AphA